MDDHQCALAKLSEEGRSSETVKKMLDAGFYSIQHLNRDMQHWDTFSPRRNEGDEESEERTINRHASRPSLSSLLRGEKITVPKPIGLI
jgi:hypothetical protein